MNPLHASISEIERALASMGGDVIVEALRPGLSDAQIDSLTSDRDAGLSGSIRELYMIHDGQPEEHRGAFFPDDIRWLPLADAKAHTDEELAPILESSGCLEGEPEGSEHWWTIATFEDFSLVTNLESGRVFWLFEGESYFAAQNLAQFFERYLEVLKGGTYTVELQGEDEDDAYATISDSSGGWVYETLGSS
jgi:hypothetical protein